MSRRNGFLQVSSGGNSGANLLSNVLSGISNKYSTKEAQEQQIERERLLRIENNQKEALLQAENKRRYEEGRDTTAANTAENTRRFELGQQQAADALARQERDRNAQFNLLSNNTVFTIDDQDPENAKIFRTIRENENKEIEGVKNFLSVIGTELTDEDKTKFKTKDERDRTYLGKALQASSNNLLRSNSLDGDSIDDNDAFMRRIVNLEAMKKEFQNSNFSEEEKANRINEIIKTSYIDPRAELDRKIAQGVGIPTERRVEIALSRLPENIRNDLLSPANAAAILASRVGGSSEAEIRTRENARVDNLFKNSESFADATEKAARLNILYRNSNKRTGNNSSVAKFNRTDRSPEEVKSALNTKMFGGVSEVSEDNKEIAEYVNYLADEGFSEYEIERAIMANIEPGKILDFSLGDTNVGSLEEIQASAEDIKSNRANNSRPNSNSNYSGFDIPTAKDLMSVKQNSRSLAELAMSELGLDRPNRRILKSDDNYRQEVLSSRFKEEKPTVEAEVLSEQAYGPPNPFSPPRNDYVVPLRENSEEVKNVSGRNLDAGLIEDASNRLEILREKRGDDDKPRDATLERMIQFRQKELKDMEEKFAKNIPLNKKSQEKARIEKELDDLKKEKSRMNTDSGTGKARIEAINNKTKELQRRMLLLGV